MRRRIVLLLFLTLLSAVLIFFAPSAIKAQHAAPDFAPDQVLVQFKARVPDHVAAAVISASGARSIERFRLAPSLHLVELPEPISVERAIQFFQSNINVQFAEPNFIYRSQVIPNDPNFGDLWGLHNTGQGGGTADVDVDSPESWDISTGSKSVVVGIVDTGIDYKHEDIAANMWKNPGEIAGNRKDDDGNGYVDDVFGINAVKDTGNPLDDHDHGTHVSGTVGAVGNNGKGVVGVNWTAQLMALKFLNAGGLGLTSDAIQCIDYATEMKLRGAANVVALNNSWGGGGFSQALQDAISRANGAGILFVAAAGNNGSNNDEAPVYPASYEVANVVAVAAIDRNDNLASFSNYGAISVDLGAPGVSILSTTRRNRYKTFSGTSMATPHVTGVAALVSGFTGLGHLDVKQRIFSTVIVTPALTGKTVTGGRVNAYRALANDTTSDPK